MTLTPIAERVAVELPLHVYRLGSVAVGVRTPNIPLAGRPEYVFQKKKQQKKEEKKNHSGSDLPDLFQFEKTFLPLCHSPGMIKRKLFKTRKTLRNNKHKELY